MSNKRTNNVGEGKRVKNKVYIRNEKDMNVTLNLVLSLQLLKVEGVHLLHQRPGKRVEVELVSDLSHYLPQKPPQRTQIVLLPSQKLPEYGPQ